LEALSQTDSPHKAKQGTMRYQYRCDYCAEEREVFHRMTEDPEVLCDCGKKMRRVINSPSLIRVTGLGLKGRGILSQDRPSDREYRAYLAWERAGGDPGTPEHMNYLVEKGEIEP
jgi:putative FmdB family regulatory protein